MEKVNFKKILSEKANFAIHCETAAEARCLFLRLKEKGFTWADNEVDDRLDINDTDWHFCKKETVYILNIEAKKITSVSINRSLFSKDATPFKKICFCDECGSCKLTPSV